MAVAVTVGIIVDVGVTVGVTLAVSFGVGVTVAVVVVVVVVASPVGSVVGMVVTAVATSPAAILLVSEAACVRTGDDVRVIAVSLDNGVVGTCLVELLTGAGVRSSDPVTPDDLTDSPGEGVRTSGLRVSKAGFAVVSEYVPPARSGTVISGDGEDETGVFTWLCTGEGVETTETGFAVATGVALFIGEGAVISGVGEGTAGAGTGTGVWVGVVVRLSVDDGVSASTHTEMASNSTARTRILPIRVTGFICIFSRFFVYLLYDREHRRDEKVCVVRYQNSGTVGYKE